MGFCCCSWNYENGFVMELIVLLFPSSEVMFVGIVVNFQAFLLVGLRLMVDI